MLWLRKATTLLKSSVDDRVVRDDSYPQESHFGTTRADMVSRQPSSLVCYKNLII